MTKMMHGSFVNRVGKSLVCYELVYADKPNFKGPVVERGF
jgi:hypothetical protein